MEQRTLACTGGGLDQEGGSFFGILLRPFQVALEAI